MARFEVRWVEAWASTEEGLWEYNNVFPLSEMRTKAKDERRALTRHLRVKHGITFKRGKTRIEFDGDNYTIVARKDGEPLFDAIFIAE